MKQIRKYILFSCRQTILTSPRVIYFRISDGGILRKCPILNVLTSNITTSPSRRLSSSINNSKPIANFLHSIVKSKSSGFSGQPTIATRQPSGVKFGTTPMILCFEIKRIFNINSFVKVKRKSILHKNSHRDVSRVAWVNFD